MSSVVDVRDLVTVAEITPNVRGLSVEVPLDADIAGLPEASVVNCDGLYTVRHSALKRRAGEAGNATMNRVCRAVALALGC